MHWRTIFRNIFSNWAGYLLSAVVSFTLAPFLVHSLGKTGYGIWALILSLTSCFGLLDLGIRSSVGRFVARYLALQDPVNVNRIVNTAFAILAAAGAATMLSTAMVVQFFFSRLQVGPEFEPAAKTALLLVGLNVGLILPLGVFGSVLIALERYDVLNTITVFVELLRAVAVVCAVKLGYGLPAIAVVTLLTSLLHYGSILLFVKRTYPSLQMRLRYFDKSALRSLAGFGIFRFIWIVANQLIFYSDTLVVGMFLGAASVTYYAIAGSLMNTGRNFVSLLTDTLMPSATRMDARQDTAGLQQLLILGTRMALLVALPLCCGFIFLGKQFLTLWMGREFAVSGTILGILTIPQISSMSQYVSANILTAMAKHRILAYLTIAEGAANLILSVILVRRFGLLGVAFGTVIPHLLTTAVILPIYTLRTLRLGARDYLVKGFLRPALCAVPMAAMAYWFSANVDEPTWTVFLCEAVSICAVFSVLAYFVCLETSQRERIAGKLRQVLNREAVVHET